MNKKFGLVFIILFLCVGCEKTLYCENGYELKGEKCVKEIVTLAKQKVSGYSCYTSV